MVDENIQLKPYNAFGTEAFAKLFCEPSSVSELERCLIKYAAEKKLIIGGGCNLFFTKNFDGLVIKPSLRGVKLIAEDEDTVCVEAMASEDWDEFVQYCVEKGYAGLENLSLIPGTVGASPIQNIGAYGAEVGDCIEEVVALKIDSGETLKFSNTDCKFAYRDSFFKENFGYVVVSVLFRLKKKFTYVQKYEDLNRELEQIPFPSILDVRKAVIKIRERKLPDHNVLPNCGSFFKNPYIRRELADRLIVDYPNLPVYPQKDGLIKTSAAFLIDKAGYRGKRNGNLGTYPNQALIMVNYGATDGNEIIRFKNEIQAAVKNLFDIELEPEVRIL